MSFFEEISLRKNFKLNHSLNTLGYFKVDKKNNLNISNKTFSFILSDSYLSFFANKYHKRIILRKSELDKIIKTIFDRNFCDYITSITGFKYTIDFFGAYQNFYIPQEDRNGAFYANHYHLDKPNSKNMLKIFLPMSEIRFDDGPLRLLNINKTKDYFSEKKINESEIIDFTGDVGDIFICRLNLCLHKACIPSMNKPTSLIMVQLNPSTKWFLNSQIYKRQFRKEPKFTSLINTVFKKIPLLEERT